MTDKRIKIYFNKETQINDALFHYSGWIDIKKAICYTSSGKYSASKKIIDDTWDNIKYLWSENEQEWESFDAKIGANIEKRRSLTYISRGAKIRRTPKIKGL